MALGAATAVLLAFCAAACSRRGAVGSDSSGTRDAPRPVPSGAAGAAEAFDAEADAEDAPPAAVKAARRDPGDGFRSFRAGRLRSGRSPAAAPRRPEIRWTFRTKDAIVAQPVVAADGTALVASLDGTLYALSPDGSLRWTFPAGDRIYSTPWIADSGQVVFGSDADRLHALDLSGKVLWTMLRPDDAERPDLHDVDTAPVATRSAVYVGAGLYLYALDMEGLVRWRVATGGKVFSSPALLPDGTIVVGSQDGHLWAVRPDGTARWKYRTRGDVDSTPAVDEVAEAIYVGSDDGMVHAVSFRGTRL
ncbi:MAG: PQQ-binding-like beta-propeller repeat protein [Myxococcota bacterium]|nr:PQQ-binding-like beta-propeller repeat protein [Myxococcota bacterium]